jgi:CRP-like cAMP-binding protein
MADTLTNARKLIEARLAEVRQEIAQLDRALRDLGTSGRQPSQSRPRRSATPSRRRGETVSRSERMNSLAAQARKAPEATNAELAKALKVTPSYISQLLAEGRKTGLIARRSGKLVVRGAGTNNAGRRAGKGSRNRTSRPSSARVKAAQR